MLHIKHKIKLRSFSITIFTNDKYFIEHTNVVAPFLTPLESIQIEVRGILLDQSNADNNKCFLDFLDLVQNDPDPWLRCRFVDSVEHCSNCGKSTKDSIITPSYFSPSAYYEMVCDDCEKNRWLEYLRVETLPPF